MKPGAHLLAFGGTRTHHRLACAIEDAGFEIRDCIMWVYGSGFPKSHDVSKAIDKAAGAERKIVSSVRARGHARRIKGKGGIGAARPLGAAPAEFEDTMIHTTAPATPDAVKWDGWGTALKPAWEPVIVARWPVEKGATVAANVVEHGTGALNIDACRVPADHPTGWGGGGSKLYDGGLSRAGGEPRPTQGRWPANVIHDGSSEVLDALPGQSAKNPARFFYCAKANKNEREAGLHDREARNANDGRVTSIDNAYQRGDSPRRNTHPTVKPIALMRYLVRLVTPPGGVVLDPFMGSGSTLIAAGLEGFDSIGIELDSDFCEIAKARIKHAHQEDQKNG